MDPINVFARWRPLSKSEIDFGEINYGITADSGALYSVAIKPRVSTEGRPWSSSPAFHTIFNPKYRNKHVYQAVVAPCIPKVLRGESCSFFAYGHSGSGKTHTILGYDYQDTEELGLCLAASRQLFDALHLINEENKEQRLGIGFSLFELRNKSAFDLLNHGTQCHVRQGPDGKVHIRGKTEILEEGKVRVCPIIQRSCWGFETLKEELIEAIGRRAEGASSIHDQSSRTHAVLELEIVSQPLIDARHALYDRQSELVPVGKRATDIKIEEESKGLVRTPDGGWTLNPDYRPNQERIEAVELEKAQFEARVTDAEDRIDQILASSSSPCLGTKMVFVDLAGAEYSEGNMSGPASMKQTSQERQEGRQINTDLLALKEVMRAWSRNEERIPFRSSTLTMVLREHFLNTGRGNSTIIVTLSPAADQYAATLNSLKYASLVGAAST
ncbi:kinesin family [Fusarium beomiforme]|uniref:Kinesin family n=1 Tax=Fusarium beomiforme TaxID=44412 RepID=A0A9P5E361_9HYPO|nr:kinesin family [Fusarium beomiforme]